jgi:GNAT superfamily N-acetyltransferase
VVEEPISRLVEHARISAAFETGRGIKDYDAVEDPARWAATWDLGNWALLVAYDGLVRVGGCVVAFDTPGFEMLEGRTDLAVLWDIRVDPPYRRRGVGTALFEAAGHWARARGCRTLRVETQDNNAAACRLYERCGCMLARVRPGAYPMLPAETQLIWELALDQGPRSQSSR